jgi:hypothetical protein
VQHVRVAEQPTPVPPRPVPRLGRGVAVEGGGTHVGHREPVERAQLIGGERLRRRQVEGGGPGVVGEPREHGQLVGERLARRGPGGDHHVTTGPRVLGRLGLVAPRHRHPPVGERLPQPGRHPLRPGHGPALARGQPHGVPQRARHVAVGRPLVPGEQAVQQQLAPPLRFTPVTHGARGWHTAPTPRPARRRSSRSRRREGAHCAVSNATHLHCTRLYRAYLVRRASQTPGMPSVFPGPFRSDQEDGCPCPPSPRAK